MADTGRINIGFDIGREASITAFRRLIVEGTTILIIDEETWIGEALHEAIEKLRNADFSELEERIVGAAGQMSPYELSSDGIDQYLRDHHPVKVVQEPVPDHDPHPKAKAKLPYFHNRRRF